MEFLIPTHMKHEDKDRSVSRSTFLKTGLALPFLPLAQQLAAAEQNAEDDEFETMLTADGKAVKVRKGALKEAKVINDKMSNQSLLSWLKPKNPTK